MTNWEEIDVPKGAFIGWGDTAGQHVTGKVLSYSDSGGTNFAGDPCPQISIELVEPAASFNKSGQRTDFPAGELVVINAGQANLSRGVRAASLNAGDLVKITLESFEKSANGTVKVFGIKVARGAGGSSSAPAQAAASAGSSFDAAPASTPPQAAAPF